MAVTLLRAYGGTPAGQVVEFSAELESALVAQGLASTANATATTLIDWAIITATGFTPAP
ncbi:MAG: hypothetical protein ACK5QX_01100 [bacterium]|jgi:hypothetical protein